MERKTYKDIAAMQKNPSATGSTGATRGKPKTATGGRIKVATGGRVRKQGGSVTKIKGRGGPNVSPSVNVLGVPAAQAHQRAQAGATHASELASQQGAPSQRTTVPGPGRGARSGRPDFKKGGRASKAKGGKAKR